jgi:DNA repair exonuclease SbcCD ATPase subunit
MTFGSDQGTSTDTATFTKDDIEKVLNQNRHAQDHIRTLESETAQMRAELERMQAELAQARSIDDLLDVMRQQDPNQPGPTAPQFDQERLIKTLKEEVFRDLTAAQQATVQVQNWNKSIEMLRQRHGDGYSEYVTRRAQELNLPIEKMEDLAKTSPDAFMELVSTRGTTSAAPTTGSVVSPLRGAGDTDAMYSKINTLRFRNTPEGREAKRMWEDPEFQRQYRIHILTKMEKQGSSFSNK